MMRTQPSRPMLIIHPIIPPIMPSIMTMQQQVVAFRSGSNTARSTPHFLPIRLAQTPRAHISRQGARETIRVVRPSAASESQPK
jgi:hypothetical protein